MDLIPNDWKHLLRTEISQKIFLKAFYYNDKDTTKVKGFKQSFQIHFILKLS